MQDSPHVATLRTEDTITNYWVSEAILIIMIMFYFVHAHSFYYLYYYLHLIYNPCLECTDVTDVYWTIIYNDSSSKISITAMVCKIQL